MRAYRAAIAAALWIGLAGLAGQVALADPALENMVEICADADKPPAEALKFCYRAMDKRAMDRQPAAVRARVMLNAGIAAYNLGRYGEAADNQTRALEIDPSLALALVHRAQAYEKTGREPDALADYEAALAAGVRDANAYLGRGVLRLKSGDAEGALADFDAANRLEPQWSAPLFNRGVTLARLGRWERAEVDFSAVVARHPDDAQALLNRAKARAALGRRDALADFGRVLELRPEWGAGWFARGEFLDAVGETEAANADFLRAYELGHADPRLIERVERIGGG